MRGKDRCKLLKELRHQIAVSNNIELMTSECQYHGECKGTCPKCEAELHYLEQELVKKQKLGQKIVIAGLAATIVASSVSCSPIETELTGDVLNPNIENSNEQESDHNSFTDTDEEIIELDGDVAYYTPDFENSEADE